MTQDKIHTIDFIISVLKEAGFGSDRRINFGFIEGCNDSSLWLSATSSSGFSSSIVQFDSVLNLKLSDLLSHIYNLQDIYLTED